MCFEFPFNLTGKLTMLYVNRPVMACAQNLVHMWGPGERILVLFGTQTFQMLSSVCCMG